MDKSEIHNAFYNIFNDKDKYFEDFYRKYYGLVYKICFNFLKNVEDSHDVTQNVFKKIYVLDKEKLPQKSESSWLYIVAKNEALSFVRGNRNDEELFEIPVEEKDFESFIDIDNYNFFVSKLNDIDREIVGLKVLSGFKFREIAEILGMPTATVQFRYYKALKLLRKYITMFSVFIVATILSINEYSSVRLVEVKEFTKELHRNESDDEKKSESPSNIFVEDKKENFENEIIGTEKYNINVYNKEVLDFGFISGFVIVFIFSFIFFKKFFKYPTKLIKKSSK